MVYSASPVAGLPIRVSYFLPAVCHGGERPCEADQVGGRSECFPQAQLAGAEAEIAMNKIMRCPYCVERGEFMPMIERSDGNWFACDRCGHLVLPQNPMYKCTCARCAQTVQAPTVRK